jgi:hypothetical protein
MGFLKTIFRETVGLFVDDGSFALAIVVWIAFVKVILPRFAFAARWHGIILFVGLALILVESVLRFARRDGTRGSVK